MREMHDVTRFIVEHPFTAENAPEVFRAMADPTRLKILDLLLASTTDDQVGS